MAPARLASGSVTQIAAFVIKRCGTVHGRVADQVMAGFNATRKTAPEPGHLVHAEVDVIATAVRADGVQMVYSQTARDAARETSGCIFDRLYLEKSLESEPTELAPKCLIRTANATIIAPDRDGTCERADGN